MDPQGRSCEWDRFFLIEPWLDGCSILSWYAKQWPKRRARLG
jgi:hypothetical protein